MRLRRDKYDAAFSDFIRWRDRWTCRHCHRPYAPPTSELHCAHIHSRGNRSIRWDEDNAIALCFRCHQHFTGYPIDFHEWLQKEVGQAHLDRLAMKRHTVTKFTRADKDMLRAHYLMRIDVIKNKLANGVTHETF